MALNQTVRAVLFDVFGTVVDWRNSVIYELTAFGNRHQIVSDWADFADRWRAGFRTLQKQIAHGRAQWMSMDEIHRTVLDQLLGGLKVSGLNNEDIAQLNCAWHRLRPWPDSVMGITRLKSNYIVAPLSNGNLSMLVAIAKHAGLPWDCVLSTAMFSSYKPDPKVYLGAAELLRLAPHEVMLVAAHAYDCDGARAAGLKTAYVFRPAEFGPGRGEDPGDTSRFELVTTDFLELAEMLRS